MEDKYFFEFVCGLETYKDGSFKDVVFIVPDPFLKLPKIKFESVEEARAFILDYTKKVVSG